MIPAEEEIVLPMPSISRVVARVMLIVLACVTALGTVVGCLGYLFLAFALLATGSGGIHDDVYVVVGGAGVVGLALAVFFGWSARKLRST